MGELDPTTGQAELVGRTLKHYQVESLLGRGGMGVVYRARDTRLDRPVALKVLKPELTTDPARKGRFLREARSACAVTHPAIAQIYDVDEVDGTTFIAMELVEGRTLRELVVDRELDLASSVEIATQVVEALGRAHEAGIVHRDIKSDNIMVSRDGHAKILDFGLAKLLDPGTSRDGGTPESQIETVAQTQAGMVLGTIAYMSPEQARGRTVDQRSDLFSVGIVLYEMVTGELPFKGDSPLDTLHAIAFEEVQPVTVIRRNLPPDLHRIVTRCLRKKPEDRYPDARTLLDDLKVLKRDLDSGIRRSLPPEERAREAFEWVKRSLPHGPAGIAVAAGAVLVVGYLLFANTDVGSVLVLAFLGLLLYRYVRNRRPRMIKRFVSKIRKLPEVQAVTVRGDQVTVVVERAQAKVFVKVNNLVDAVNSKQFFGDPIEANIRDDLSTDELRQLLREPGVVHVRDDLFDEDDAGKD